MQDYLDVAAPGRKAPSLRPGPAARILDGMRRGAFPFLLSDQLLAEYRQVLLRAKIRKLHGLDAHEVDLVLTEIATRAIVHEPETRSGAPDPKDNHLWSLLHDQPGSVLVTGDRALAQNPPLKSTIVQPREFAGLLQKY